MTNLFSLPLALAITIVAHAQTEPAVPMQGPKVSFDREVYHYDTIPQGSDGRCEFVLTNVGDEPLIITSVKSSCGCVVPSWDKDPVLPGKTTTLRVLYDTNRVGPFNKTLTLRTNAVDRSVVVLMIKGVVKVRDM